MHSALKLLPFLVLVSLTGCGTSAPVIVGSTAAQLAASTNMEAQNSIFRSNDIPAICKKIIKDQTKAKANKTNVALMNTVLYHVETLAKQQHAPAVQAIAKAELKHQNVLNKKVETNLPTALAEEMKAGMLDAFAKIQAIAKPAPAPADTGEE